MQIIAEQRIENGLLSITQKILNPLHRLYTKKSCNFFQSYEKRIYFAAFISKYANFLQIFKKKEGNVENNMYLCVVFPYAESPMGNLLWRDTYILKAFSGRFGFDILRISQIRTNGQKQSNGNAPWRCRLYMSLPLFFWDRHLYIHRRGAFCVARFDQLGRCESLQNVDRAQDWLHVFVCMKFTRIKISA